MKKGSYKVRILKTTLPRQKKGKTRKYYRGFYRFLEQSLLKLKPRRQESVVCSPSPPS